MPKKKVFDAKQLMKNAHYRALVEAGEVVSIKGGRSAGKAEKVKLIHVGKKSSIVIPAEKVAELEIAKDAMENEGGDSVEES